MLVAHKKRLFYIIPRTKSVIPVQLLK